MQAKSLFRAGLAVSFSYLGCGFFFLSLRNNRLLSCVLEASLLLLPLWLRAQHGDATATKWRSSCFLRVIFSDRWFLFLGRVMSSCEKAKVFFFFLFLAVGSAIKTPLNIARYLTHKTLVLVVSASECTRTFPSFRDDGLGAQFFSSGHCPLASCVFHFLFTTSSVVLLSRYIAKLQGRAVPLPFFFPHPICDDFSGPFSTHWRDKLSRRSSLKDLHSSFILFSPFQRTSPPSLALSLSCPLCSGKSPPPPAPRRTKSILGSNRQPDRHGIPEFNFFPVTLRRGFPFFVFSFSVYAAVSFLPAR